MVIERLPRNGVGKKAAEGADLGSRNPMEWRSERGRGEGGERVSQQGKDTAAVELGSYFSPLQPS